MLEFLIMITLFLRPVYSGLLLVLGVSTDKIPLSLVYILAAGMDYLYIFVKCLCRHTVKEKLWVSSIIMLVLLALQLVTGMKYDGLSGDYLDSVFSFVALSIPSFILGLLLTEKNDFIILGKVMPVFIIAISAVTIYADFSTLKSVDGLIHTQTTYNIDYQNCAYYAAYSFGINMFYILYGKELHLDHKAKRMRMFLAFLLPVQLFVVLTSGGRGGFLLGSILMMYFLLLVFCRYQKRQAYYVGILVIIMIVAIGLFAYLSQKGEAIRGFSRLASFLENPEDTTRNDLYSKAIKYFWERPFIGNGIGSVWFTVGYYSHDIFCDLLCETGVVGTGAFVAVLIWYGAKTIKMIKQNSAHQFGLLIFFFVFIMLLFSGYYLTEPMLWFALAYTLFADTKAKETDAITVS